MISNPQDPASGARDAFYTTRWTLVCLAKADSDEGRRALADLCQAYYEPIIVFLRCQAHGEDAAREAAHEFFAQMLAGGAIATAEQGRGRFRSYLLGAVKHFLSHRRQRAERLKRGGGAEMVSMDDEEVSLLPELRDPSPDAAFDRQWATTVLTRGLEGLRVECVNAGRGEFFESVKPLLTGNADHGVQAELAAASGMNLTAFRMAVHRLKRRLRQCVKSEVACTLDNPALVQEEMESLFAALGN